MQLCKPPTTNGGTASPLHALISIIDFENKLLKVGVDLSALQILLQLKYLLHSVSINPPFECWQSGYDYIVNPH